MTVRDEPLVRDLLRPANLPDGGDRVEFVATHGSFVFLTERSVYKVKRAKDYGFFDYSTLGARKHFCELEVSLNRRTAPDVYLGVLSVTRDARGYSLTRGGETVDYAVHMRRLPDARSARALVAAGNLLARDLAAVARFAADFYRRVQAYPPDPRPLEESIAENFAQVQPFVGRFVGGEEWGAIRAAQKAWLARSADRLAMRPRRDGHGDLRLEHVYLLPDGPLLIDCIEFAERLRIGDAALDAAFLAMDLHAWGRADLAAGFLARFAYESDDYGLYPLIDGYMSYRAVVRAKVACFVAADAATPPAVAARKAAEARAFFTLARSLLEVRHPSPCLIGIGGLIAAGKSTLADEVSRRTGTPVVSADATRKWLAGIARDERGSPALYTAETDARVHDELLARANDVLASGRSVIIDTTFRTRGLRERARRAAHAHGGSFLLVECRAPEAVLRARLRARAGGVSDAREAQLDAFLAGYDAPDELPPDERSIVDTTEPLDDCVARIERTLAKSR
jgi:hypothetical protein